MEQRAHYRHEFEFLVLEHRPDGDRHPQATRLLHCTDFSLGGMKLRGEPRFDQFKVTLCIPHDGSRVDADVEVVNRAEGYFGVRFINPAPELSEKLSWWQAPADHVQNLDTGV